MCNGAWSFAFIQPAHMHMHIRSSTDILINLQLRRTCRFASPRTRLFPRAAQHRCTTEVQTARCFTSLMLLYYSSQFASICWAGLYVGGCFCHAAGPRSFSLKDTLCSAASKLHRHCLYAWMRLPSLPSAQCDELHGHCSALVAVPAVQRGGVAWRRWYAPLCPST